MDSSDVPMLLYLLTSLMGTRENKLIIMRKLILALILCACSYSAYSQNQIPLPSFNYTPLDTQGRVIKTSLLDDGRYKASVQYYNKNTGTKSTYSLQVYVDNDRVTKIYFSNGGYIQKGSNDYQGGDLDFYTDRNGNLDSANTTVRVYRNGGYEYYKIEL